MKRAISVLFCFLILFNFISCKDKKKDVTDKSREYESVESTDESIFNDQTNSETPPEWLTYNGDGFKIDYLSVLDVDSSGYAGTKVIFNSKSGDNDDFVENVRLNTAELEDKNMVLDDYLKLAEKQIKQYVDGAEVQECYRQDQCGIIRYSEKQNNINIIRVQNIYLNRGVIYALTMSYQENKGDFFIETGQKIMTGFRFK
jgi:hypothetical protein